jgi:50S ribosomal subunit-associated GTPase HflX
MHVYVDPHALTHGLSECEVFYAWENYVRKRYRKRPNNDRIIAIGYDQSERLIEMVASEKLSHVLIYHALTPPTKKMLKELGLERRGRWSIKSKN